MISSKHRFHGYNSLKTVYKTGSTIRGPLFSVKSALNPRRRSYRVAVVVSKKVHKSAVTRNRIRRRLYEAVRLLQPDINEPFDIVINVFSDAVIAEDSKSLQQLLKKQFKQSNILK